MRETRVSPSGVVSGDNCRSQPPEEGGRGMLSLGQIRLHLDADLFTIEANVICRDPSCCGRPGDVPCR